MWKHAAFYICCYPKTIVIIALAFTLPAALAAVNVGVNYDIFSYMPADISSIKGQQILKDNYNAASTGFVLLEKQETAKLLHLKKNLSDTPGISRVLWISDLVDPAIPQSFIPSEILSVFQKDNHVLFCLLFADAAGADKTMGAVKEIRKRLSGTSVKACTGLPMLVQDLTRLVTREKNRAVISAVVISGIVVGLAMRSWLIPLLFLFSIGISIVYNMGTNFLQGSISYVTEAVAVVIQLGVTFDFSIFLTHRFQEELQHAESARRAMSNAINSTFKAVAPAALTTITGFLALALMEIRIGLDMGVVMAKGVFLGLVVSLTLLPALLLLTAPYLPVRHRAAGTAPAARKGPDWPVRWRWLLLAAFILLFLPAVYGRYQTDLSYSIKAMLPERMPSVKSMETIKDIMGQSDVATILLPGETSRRQLAAVTREINRLPHINRAVSLGSLVDPAVPEDFVPSQLTDTFNQGGYTRILAGLTASLGTEAANTSIANIRDILSSHGLNDSYVTGKSAITKDLVTLSRHDIPIVNMASLLGILFIVTVIFRSVAIPVILIAGIQLAIYINLAIPYYMGDTIPFLTFTAISAIQLGTTVDYAILLMTRYREEYRRHPPGRAIAISLRGTAPAILVAGLSLFSATIGLVFISQVETLRSMALMIGRGALISMAVILVLVPAVIMICDKLIVYTSIGWRPARSPAASGSIRKKHDKGE